MAKPRFTVYVEDYNVPLSPWYILQDSVLRKDIVNLSNGEIPSIDGLFVYEKDFVTWGPDAAQFQTAADYFIRRLTAHHDFLEDIIHAHESSFAAFRSLAQQLSEERLKEMSNPELFDLYQRYYDITCHVWVYSMPIQTMDMGAVKFSQQVKDALGPALDRLGEREIMFSRLTTPIQSTAVAEEQRALVELIRTIQQDSSLPQKVYQSKQFGDLPASIQEGLIDLQQRFGWMQYYYLGPAAPVEYYYDLMMRRMQDSAETELERFRRERTELEQFQRDRAHQFSDEEQFQLRVLREFQYLKEARKEIHIYFMNHAMHAWYKEVGRRFQWSVLQTRYIFRDEWEQILRGSGMPVDEDDLNERYACCAYLSDAGKTKLVTGSDARAMKSLYIQPEHIAGSVKELKGSVAFPGTVRGTVKIVNSVNDLAKFNDGDILVSFSTNPSLVPAMNKAAAIVTNTGGVTCHAAIVSREMKIPCIIGTNIATRVLHDGDRIEVDAAKGIVRKIG